jgi:hypothetical protein
MLKNRVRKLRSEVKLDTQKLRDQTIQHLQELFALAKEQAQNPNVKLTQRQSWTRVATYICQVINTIATHLDERQIDQDLKTLEELVNETATKNKTQKTPTTA